MRDPRALSRPEFITLMAMMAANIAFSIDAMLPAFTVIGAELSPDVPTRVAGIILMFVFGMGLGTLVAGPMSDAFGRKPVVIWSVAVFCAGAAWAYVAQSLEALLAARLLQGLGAAGPRVVVMAIIRDLYQGRGMAKIQSFVMMVFALVPAVAPLIGAQIIGFAGWRSIFLAFILFSMLFTLWLMIRQPETLPPEARRPLSFPRMWAAFREVIGHRIVMTSVALQAIGYGMLFGTLASVEPIFGQTFDKADSFPLWFGVVAVIAASASILNATFVERMGMVKIIRLTLIGQLILSSVIGALWVSGALPEAAMFPLFMVWMVSIFFQAAPVIGNTSALAMQPMGHIAGLAAAIITCLATVGGVVIAAPLSQSFNGTPAPIMIGVAGVALLALLLLATLPKDADAG